MSEQWGNGISGTAATDLLPRPTSAGLEPAGHLRNCSTLQVVHFLLGTSSVDDLAQFLVLQQLATLHPWQMSIYAIGTDSLLRLLGSFGQPDGKGDLHEKSCLEDTPAGQALRDGLPQANFALDGEVYLPTVPIVDGDLGPQVLWPLLTSHRLCGLLQLRFATEPDIDLLSRSLAAVAPPVALLVDLEGSPAFGPEVNAVFSLADGAGPDAFPTRPLRSLPGGRRRGFTLLDHPSLGGKEPGPEDLSQRQREVLQYMSEGMTNGQIARILRFSESTVRQETMAIYRALRVGGRVEAVAFARQIGLLPAT